MNTPTLFFEQLEQEIPTIPPASIVSRTLVNTAATKVILFGFAAGQELSEHTAARPAILHFLRGEATVTLGNERYAAQGGTFAFMPAHLPHSIVAQSEVVLLLLMLTPERADQHAS